MEILSQGSPGFLQVHPGYLSKSSWPLTLDRVSPLCPSVPPVRFLYHRLAYLRPSSPPLGYCALSLSKSQSLLTTPWVPNIISNSATHHQDEKTSQLVVNLKPSTLQPPEPPPVGFCLNHFSTDELLVTDCVFFVPHQNRHGCIGLGSSLLR
ncbi:hypothetical protein TSUD_97170 [Trifolium subterraneum]|nr:hypothetical protein TSUD_97170 [Trifolium subterraneum]